MSTVSCPKNGVYNASAALADAVLVIATLVTGDNVVNLRVTMSCLALLCIHSMFAIAQARPLPTEKALDSALDQADTALKNYQRTLALLKDEPVIAATSHKDAEPLMVGGMAIILLRTKAVQAGTVDLMELATLFANIDAASLNAALSAGNLALKIPTAKLQDTDRIIKAANSLIEDTQQLQRANDAVWHLLEACTNSQPPLHLRR